MSVQEVMTQPRLKLQLLSRHSDIVETTFESSLFVVKMGAWSFAKPAFSECMCLRIGFGEIYRTQMEQPKFRDLGVNHCFLSIPFILFLYLVGSIPLISWSLQYTWVYQLPTIFYFHQSTKCGSPVSFYDHGELMPWPLPVLATAWHSSAACFHKMVRYGEPGFPCWNSSNIENIPRDLSIRWYPKLDDPWYLGFFKPIGSYRPIIFPNHVTNRVPIHYHFDHFQSASPDVMQLGPLGPYADCGEVSSVTCTGECWSNPYCCGMIQLGQLVSMYGVPRYESSLAAGSRWKPYINCQKGMERYGFLEYFFQHRYTFQFQLEPWLPPTRWFFETERSLHLPSFTISIWATKTI